MLATALISFGFFGGIVFIPLWFQAVNGSTATQSGYQILPMMAGLMAGSIGSGQIVSRTGRYKWLLAGAMTIATVGILLMTQLHADTPVTTMWVWLAIMGLGIGPSMAVFTIIVQNAVPVRAMGTATSSLTFFRQIGGSIGLAIAGTVFGSSIISGLAPALVKAGVPAEIANQIPQHVSQGEVTSVGGNLGGDLVSRLPEAVRPVIEPLLPAIINGVHEAFSTRHRQRHVVRRGRRLRGRADHHRAAAGAAAAAARRRGGGRRRARETFRRGSPPSTDRCAVPGPLAADPVRRRYDPAMAEYDPATALIVVDVQNDFADPAGSLFGCACRTDPAAHQRRGCSWRRAAGAAVVYTQDWHPESTPHFAKDGGIWPVHCVADTWGAELHPDLIVAGEVVRKGSNGEDGYSGFTMRDPVTGAMIPTPLEPMLRERGVSRVVICGLATDYCVNATALDARRLGFETQRADECGRRRRTCARGRERALTAMADAGAELVGT